MEQLITSSGGGRLTRDGLQYGLLRRLPGVPAASPAAGAAAEVRAAAAAGCPPHRWSRGRGGGGGREAMERVGKE